MGAPADSGQRTRGLYLVLQLDGQRYGVPVSRVREILPMVEITPVPKSPQQLRGVINLRGTIVPVLDLRRKLRLPDRAPDAHTCIVIAEDPDRGSPGFGVLADRVLDCLEISEITQSDEDAMPPVADMRYIHGIGQIEGGIVILLDLDRVLSPAERKSFRGV